MPRILPRMSPIRWIALLAALASGPVHAVPLVEVLTLQDSVDPIPATSTLTYSVQVSNVHSSLSANGVNFALALPAGVTFLSASNGACSFSAPNVSCALGTLLPEQDVGITIDVRVTAAGGSVLTAQATATSSTPGETPSVIQQTTTVISGADLALSMAASPDPVPAGAVVTYTLDTQNLGPDVASGLRIVDTLPPNVAFEAFSGAGWSCSAAGSTVTCNRAGSLANGASSALTIQARVQSSISGTLTNSATLTATTGDGLPNNNTTTAQVNVLAGADLSITKLASPNPMIASAPATFTLQPRNAGPDAASAVTVTDTLPVGFTAISASGTNWSCSVSQPSRSISCTRAAMPVGASNDITINATAPDNTVVPPAGLVAANTANVAATTADPEGANNASTVNFTVQRDGADMSIFKAKSPNPVAAGSPLTSTMRATNGGPRALTGTDTLTITDTLQVGEDYSGSAAFTDNGWNCTFAAPTFTCARAGPLAVGATTPTLTLVTTATSAAALTNQACIGITGAQTDPNGANNCTTASSGSTAAHADLRILKSQDMTTVPSASNVLTYTLTIGNDGPQDSSNVVIRDVIPMRTTLTGGTVINAVAGAGSKGSAGSCGVVDATVTCNYATLLYESAGTGTPNTAETAIITVTVTRPMADGSFTNTATIASTSVGDPDHSDNTSSVNTTVDPIADVEVQSKSVTPNSLEAGVDATYVITFRNRGPSTAQNVTLTDQFNPAGGDAGYEIRSVTASKGNCAPHDAGTHSIVCSVGTLAATEVQTLQVVVRPIWMAAPPGGRNLPNTATVGTTTADSDATNDSKNAVLAITGAAIDLLANISDVPSVVGVPADPLGFDATAPASNLITYRAQVSNLGPSEATSVDFVNTYTPPAGRTVTFLCDSTDQYACTGVPFCSNVSGASETGPTPQVVSCAVGDMEAGSNVHRFLRYRVDTAPAASGDTYSNAVTVSANEVDTNPGNNNASEPTAVRAKADLQVTSKTAVVASPPLQYGQTFQWQIKVRNNGPGIAFQSVLTDTLPANMELVLPLAASVSPTGSCSNTGAAQFSCNLGDVSVGAGDERTITVDVRIVRPAVAPFPTNYTNTASVSTFSVDLVPANDSNTGSVTLVKSTVAGRVYRDHDNDGVIDGGENGVASVTLTLAGTDVFGNAVSRTTTTDGTGNYLFDNLEQSNGSGYTITETQPAGFADGLEAVGSAATGAAPGGLASATIGSNTITGIVLDKDQAATGYNFGELRQNSLGGNVFADRNNNGTAQAGDTGIANVTVTLTGTDARGVVVTRSTTTNASGVYSFANVLPGTYTLTQTQPASFLDGIDTVGNRGGSGAVNDEFSAIVLTDQDGTGYNFAERPGSISGRVWRDADRNGTLDGGEAGITGVTVSLSGTDTLGNAVTRTTTTDGSGDYSFGDLPAGTYTVTETQPAGFASTTSNTLTGIVIGAAGTSAGHNFGDSTGALAGTVFFDRDANGASNGSDDGIAGVTLTLAGTNAAGGAVILTTTTDATGAFAFNDLLAPDASGYTLTQTQPTAYANGQVTAGSAAGTVNQGLNRVSAIALPVGVAATGYLFAELGTPISGTVYRDANRDSVKQPGEPGITGVTVELRDSGNALVATTTTAADGSYGFPPQAGGSYTVLETQPAGYSSGPQNAGNSVAIALVAGTPAVIDFGESTGSLAGTVFLDVDNDGVQDAGDVGLPGTTVTLSGTDALGAAVSRSTTTNSAGQYLFADLLSGTYTVTETQPSLFGDGAEVLGAGNAGGTVGNDVYGAIALGIGVQATGYNFAETGSAVTGVVYRDFTRDGARQAGDTPIAGVTLTLRDAGNVVIGTTTTAADGSYLFAGVATGSYTVVESQPAGYGSSPTSPDTVAVIVPLNGAATADFADTLSTLAGAVYVDLNGNGARDAGESGIAAVTVTLTGTDAAGAAVNRSAGTDATGAFSFIDLPTPNGAGYTLAQAQPPTFADGLDAAGTAGGSAGNDVIGAIHLPVNTDATGYLFGEGGSTITGAVFRDINANGTREGADTPIAGVVIVARDATSVVVATTTTAADGSYRFVGLPAGSYTIEETQPAGYGSSTPNSVAVTVAIGSSSGADFGETTASIAGQVWADTNANGTRDAGEPPIAGVALALTGTDAAGAAVSRATVTDAAGAYSFGDVLGGTYTLTETQPGAYADGTERAGTAGGTVGNDVISAITLPVGTAATGYDFAELGQSIRGRVWRDSDRDASLDAAESGIAGVVITLRSAGTIIATTTSDATGAYSFSNIPAGQYSVDETQPLGHGSSTPDSVIVDLLAGAVTPTIDFGDTVGSLAGRVFNDTNNNGVVDPGEPGIADATVQLAGTDARGNAVTLSAVTDRDGRWRFADLVGGSYTLNEAQPAGFDDGLDAAGAAGGNVGNDTIAGIALGAAVDATDYRFGERGVAGSIVGHVWRDTDHDRARDAGESPVGQWIVELYQADVLIQTARTGPEGGYEFANVAPGSGYEVRFREPGSSAVYGKAVTNETGAEATPGVVAPGNPGGADPRQGTLRSMILPPGGRLLEQSLPLDPMGVVYDAVSRQPIPGARVTFTGPAGFDPALHLLGGAANATQVTGTDGFYQFLLLPSAPAGDYALAVTPPAGRYMPGPSGLIPACTAPLQVGGIPDPALVQGTATAPAIGVERVAACPTTSAGLAAGLATTQYFLTFTLTPGASSDVVNNHLPIDPILGGALSITKTTPLVNVTRGDLVPYTITVSNTLPATLTNVDVRDLLPPGFAYRTGTASLDGTPLEPERAGRQLTWRDQVFAPRQTRVIKLVLIVGAGVGEGEYVNQALAVNNLVNPATFDPTISNIATATVRIVPDPVFDCSDLIGKVFDDRNVNGYQDDGEPGLPNVRVVTLNGTLVTTDAEGRFHVACAAIPNDQRGSNFVMKLDERTLPSGYRVTTENPRDVRLTRGKLTKLNFGAAIHRVLRVELGDAAFEGDSTTLLPEWRQRIDALQATLADQPSVVRIAYAGTAGSKLAKRRRQAVTQLIQERWRALHREFPLQVEDDAEVRR